MRTRSIPVFACPNDDTSFQKAGGLSYVVNAGFSDNSANWASQSHTVEAFDWDNDGTAVNSAFDEDVTRATGVFWRDVKTATVAQKNASAKLGRIYDGASNTIMMGENTKAGSDTFNGYETWASPSYMSCTFILPIDVATPPTGVDFNDPPVLTALLPYPNQSKAAADGAAPYLNSLHPGIIVVGLCDGSVRTLSDGIDQTVYSRLMTPDGSKLRTPPTGTFNAERPLEGTDF